MWGKLEKILGLSLGIVMTATACQANTQEKVIIKEDTSPKVEIVTEVPDMPTLVLPTEVPPTETPIPDTPIPTIIPDTPTPTPNLVEQNFGVNLFNLEKKVQEITDANMAAHPEYQYILNPNLSENRINFFLNFNRDNDTRYGSDIFKLVSIYYEEGWKYNIISIPRDLYIPEFGDEGARINVEFIYPRDKVYLTIARITGLMPHFDVYVGDSHLFVDLIDDVLGGIEVCISDAVNDPAYGINFPKCEGPDDYVKIGGYDAVYASVSRYTDWDPARMDRQVDVFEGMKNKMVGKFKKNPLLLIKSLNILYDYYEQGDFKFRETSNPENNFIGYDTLLSMSATFGYDFLDKMPVGTGNVNVFYVPEVLHNNIPGTFMKSPDPDYKPHGIDRWVDYYIEIRRDIEETIKIEK